MNSCGCWGGEMSQTAKVAEPISGDQLYQERARRAFPLLVRQAEAGQPIFYSDLAEELGMPNPRNLNYPLGSIGQTLRDLGKEWNEQIPPLQCVVINKHDRLPGEGIGWFLTDKDDFSSLSLAQKRKIVGVALARVFAYPRWREVLSTLSLPYAPDYLDGLAVIRNKIVHNSEAARTAYKRELRALYDLRTTPEPPEFLSALDNRITSPLRGHRRLEGLVAVVKKVIGGT